MTRRALTLAAVIAAVLVGTAIARASCIFQTPAAQRARADVIFDGLVLESPTATGIQRFKVTRYIKGRGPRIVRVNTGTIRRPDGSGVSSSVSLLVRKGERWRIFVRSSARRILRTSVCDGSRRR